MTRSRTFPLAILALMLVTTGPLCAAELTARDVTSRLFKTEAGARPDFSGENLARLDLAGLDFKRALLVKANMFGADLSQADLSGADLSGADLDRVVLVGSRLDGASLEGARLLRPSVFSTLTATAAEAPSFKNVNFRHAKLFGRFTRANFEGADFTDATCAPFGRTGFIEEIWRTELASANLARANLTRADFTHALLTFADLTGANLKDAVLRNADLTGADLSGADITGADFQSAILKDVKGLSTVIGLSNAKNFAR